MIHFPAFDDARNIGSGWGCYHVKVHVGQFFGPQSSKVVDRVGDGHEESVDATTQLGEVWTGDGAAHATPMTISVEAAMRHRARKRVCLLIPGHVLNVRAR